MENPPLVIGSYRIVRQLGRGGMGVVYEAMRDDIQRRVAIKVLLPVAKDDTDASNRFINEARAVNIVKHSGLVEITEYGQLDDGSGYLVMEYLQGQTLAGRMETSGNKLSPSETVQIGVEIAAALWAAHKQSILHRDLKPGNVMLVSDSAMPMGERVKVLDFGLAKLLSAGALAAVKTKAGMTMGTVEYMSPEQCTGDSNIDGKTDVYALGCMMYEMLSGQLPFRGEGKQIMAKHITVEAEPLGKLVPTVPAPLANLVHQLLNKLPEKRPSMREVRQQLEVLAKQLPAPTRRPDAEGSGALDAAQLAALVLAPTIKSAEPETRPAPPRRQRLILGVSGLAGAALIVTALLWHAKPPIPQPIASRPTPPVDASTVIPPTPPVPPPPVTLRVISQPPGAQVVRVSDGEVLGVTPWQQELPQAAEPLRVRVHLGRFTDQERVLSRQRDDTAEVHLVPPGSHRPAPDKRPQGSATPGPKSPPATPLPTSHAKPIID